MSSDVVLPCRRAAGELLRAGDGEELRHNQAEGASQQGQAARSEEEGGWQGRGSGEEVTRTKGLCAPYSLRELHKTVEQVWNALEHPTEPRMCMGFDMPCVRALADWFLHLMVKICIVHKWLP